MSVDTPFRVVLAEDNPADVVLVRKALDEHQILCELRVIPDGATVVSFFANLDRAAHLPCPDLLLLDLYLPKVDGKEVLRQVRASERCGQINVVVMTASHAPSDQEAAEQNAAVHYFRKPSNLSQFLQLGKIIKDLLKRDS